VLDIGCGTGILSIFAIRAGAKHVYAIENAEIALYAEEIIKRNGLSDRITVIKGKMEEITLPVQSVDIIISEWMGYFLLYESMLDCVLWARDKYLVKGGKMLPDKCSVYIAALEDAEYKASKKTFWNDVYGVNMSCLTNTVMREPLVDIVH
jgi:protein arginine N-methyltransferase 1